MSNTNVILSCNSNWLTYGGNTLSVQYDPYNPLGLPSRTIRLRFTTGVTPSLSVGRLTQVSSDPNVWDYYYWSNDWSGLDLHDQLDLLEVLGANTTGVISMVSLFKGCQYLQSVALFDTSSVSSASSPASVYGTMYQMFDGCASLTSVPLYDTSNVSGMAYMFRNCNSLTTVPLLDLSNTYSTASMFAGCTSLTSVPQFNTTTRLTSIDNMFQGCTSLTTVPLFDTSRVTGFTSVFDGCTSLTTVPLFDTSNGLRFDKMFRNCSSLTYAQPFDTSRATHLLDMFYGCSSITNVPLFNTIHVTDFDRIFAGCRSVTSGALALYQQASSQPIPPTGHNSSFSNCGADTATGLAELQQIPSTWGGRMSV